MKKASIINFGSIYGFLSPDFGIYKNGNRFSAEIYGASKASIIQITKYFAVLFAKKYKGKLNFSWWNNKQKASIK